MINSVDSVLLFWHTLNKEQFWW